MTADAVGADRQFREVAMRVSGAGTVRAPAETVWAAMADRDLLLRAIPGLDRLDFSGPGRCRFTVRVAISAAGGSYAGEAVVRDTDGPAWFVLHASAAGDKGTIAADVTVRLAPGGDGPTEVSYEADAEVSGPIAGIGDRLLVSIAKRLAGDFIAGLDQVLSPAPAAQPAAAQPTAQPAGQSAERVEQPPARREQPGSAVRTRLLAGAAAGFGGVLIGVLLGRRRWSRPTGRA
jgi:uncharacterized protein